MNQHLEQKARELVEQRYKVLRAIVDEHCPHMPDPLIEFYDNKLAAGYAHYHPYKMSFNLPMFWENTQDMLHETVAHELAHLVVHYRWQLSGLPRRFRPKPHGREWQSIMRDWFNVEPARCHAYDTSTTNAKRQDRWAARCECRTHRITTTLRNKIMMGQQRVCNDCKATVRLTGERA